MRDRVRDFSSVFSEGDKEDKSRSILSKLPKEKEMQNLHQLIRSMLNTNPTQRVSLRQAIYKSSY